jgi:serine/threonine protein kinase
MCAMEVDVKNNTVASLPTQASGTHVGEDSVWLRSCVGSAVGGLHRVVRHLASGGMGHVFLVEHVRLGAYAAVKLPQPGSAIARGMLSHEAVLLAQLQHPNIVSVLDYGHMSDGVEYMLMEYVNGCELDAWIESCGSMAPARAVALLKQVASAVDYLHAHGIVHCDIKPANIMFEPRAHDFVKLIDFGIACEKSMQAERHGLIGTPAYMAPEQARGELCGPAVDVYGIAALALELLTGRPPYDYATAQDVLTAIFTEPPALPSERGIHVPGLDAVFKKGLHCDPSARYRTASDFVTALEAEFQAVATCGTAAALPVASSALAVSRVRRRSLKSAAFGLFGRARVSMAALSQSC